jgi:hypothetical protein
LPRQSRRIRYLDDRQETRATLQLLKESPLSQIAAELEEHFQFFEQMGHVSRDASGATYGLQVIADIVGRLPHSFEERFWFDAQLIHVLSLEWNGDGQKLSGTLLPRPGKEWGHESVCVPFGSLNGQQKSINLIHMPGDDALEGVDLLTYPFLCHELAHNLLYFADPHFQPAFERSLDTYLNTLCLRSVADQGRARGQSQRTINRIAEFWRPGANHQNWAHEMMMDIVALWTCGPAYLDAFCDELEDEDLDPYFVNRQHPPYAVRAEALLKASRRLGWPEYGGGLKEQMQKWSTSHHKKRSRYEYTSLTDPVLLERCVDCALNACEAYQLPQCDTRQINKVEEILQKGDLPEFGTDLIIAAWMMEQWDKNGYQLWETKVVRRLYESITS